MKPIRVLQVLAGLDMAGAETMIMNIYRRIDRSRLQFDFIVNECKNEYAYEAEIRELGGRVYRIPRYTISNYISYKQAWKNLLREHPEWRIIHGHHTTPAFIYLRVANSLNRITIAHSHIAGGENSLKSHIKVLMRYPLRYIADYLFACSNLAAKWMFGKYSDSTYIIKNAIDVHKFAFNEYIRNEKRREFKIENKFVIGHIGRFNSQKNHEFLIDIFQSVYERNNNSILMLVGGGELRQSIEKKVNDLGLTDNVIFTGIRSDIPDLLQAMDVFLFPSLYEGLPLTLIEAQASGLKCVVSENITAEVKVSNLIEFISLKKSPKYWADRILLHKNGYKRKDTSTEIINAGYDIEENAKWLEKCYISCIEEQKGISK